MSSIVEQGSVRKIDQVLISTIYDIKQLLQVDVQYLHSYQIFSRKSRLKHIKIMK